LGFDQVTRSSESNCFFLNQNDFVLVKKKKSQRIATRFLTGFCRARSPGHTGFFLSLFFLQPGPVPAPDRPGQPAGLGFKTIWKYIKIFYFLKFHFDIITLRWFENTKKKIIIWNKEKNKKIFNFLKKTLFKHKNKQLILWRCKLYTSFVNLN